VGRGVKGRSEPVPEPPDGVARVEHFPLDLDWRGALRGVSLAGGSPVHQLHLWDGERDTKAGCPGFELQEELLQVADIATVREGRDCEGEIVHVRDHQTLRDPEV